MYRPDLSTSEDHPFKKFIYVGWLEKGKDFPTGELDPKIVDKLNSLLLTGAWCLHERRIELCCFCGISNPRVDLNGKKIQTGSAQIRIPSQDGHIFVAPNMICHYVEKHHYLPPQIFLDAVMQFDLTSDWNAELVSLAIGIEHIFKNENIDYESFFRVTVYMEMRQRGVEFDQMDYRSEDFLKHPVAAELVAQIRRYQEQY